MHLRKRAEVLPLDTLHLLLYRCRVIMSGVFLWYNMTMLMHLWTYLLIWKVIASVNKTVTRGRIEKSLQPRGAGYKGIFHELWSHLKYTIIKTAVQGQIGHLAWRLGDYAQETSGGSLLMRYFFLYTFLASSSMASETRGCTTLSLHLTFALSLSCSLSSCSFMILTHQ